MRVFFVTPVFSSAGIFMLCSVAQLCLTLCDPMDCGPPGSSVDEIFQARNTRVDCHFLCKGDFLAQGLNPCPVLAGGFFTAEPPGTQSFLSQRTCMVILSLSQGSGTWPYKITYNFLEATWAVLAELGLEPETGLHQTCAVDLMTYRPVKPSVLLQ